MTSAVTPQAAIPQTLTLPQHRDAYYGGQWHKPKNGRFAESISPGTGESLGKVADCGAADAEAVRRRLGDWVPEYTPTPANTQRVSVSGRP